MSRIAYDPVKDRFASIIRNSRPLRTLFYRVLDLFFLRSWYVRRKLKEYGSALEQKGPWKLLDAGCGFGQYDRFILDTFAEVTVTSVDVKKAYLQDCRQYFSQAIAEGRIQFEYADLLAFNETPRFDFAICVDVLEHITEDVQVMKNIREALLPGGYFIMHSPSVYSEEDAGEDESFVDEHARVGYAKEDIAHKLRQAGLEPLDVAYTYGRAGHLAWQLLIKYPMLWMNRMKLWALPLMAMWYLFTLLPGLALMWWDVQQNNDRGTGIYAVARKGF